MKIKDLQELSGCLTGRHYDFKISDTGFSLLIIECKYQTEGENLMEQMFENKNPESILTTSTTWLGYLLANGQACEKFNFSPWSSEFEDVQKPAKVRWMIGDNERWANLPNDVAEALHKDGNGTVSTL